MKDLNLINRAIDYMECNLTQPLTVEMVAAATGYSRFHFTRLFQAATGMNIATYLRRRRLHEAACALLLTKKPILEIALDYQFDSQEAFTRAFKRVFSITPGLYRRRGRLTRCFLRITLRSARLVQLTRPSCSGTGLWLPQGNLMRINTVQLNALFLQRTFNSVITRKFDGICLLLR